MSILFNLAQPLIENKKLCHRVVSPISALIEKTRRENPTYTLGSRHFTLFTLVIIVAWQAKAKYSTKYSVMIVNSHIELPLFIYISLW